jgi:2-amino-4-hydroxy-6-hydroxymethyldihydropteridine diphosphokinase
VNRTVHIGLGSNLGDREHNLLDAIDALRRIDNARVTACSSLYDTAPVGPAQPRFLNAVVELECELSPQALLGILKQIERELGRVPGDEWGPRKIDLDILLWGDQIVADPMLQVPHVFLHERRFALEPLAELAPDARHPVLEVSVREMLEQVGTQDVVRQASPGWRMEPSHTSPS